MRKTAWINILSAVLAAIAAVSSIALGICEPQKNPGLLVRAGIWFRPYALPVGLAVAGVLLVAQIFAVWLGGPAFRKDTIRSLLDGLPKQLKGNERRNRVTLFRRRKGWQIWCILMWRLRWRPWRKPKLQRMRALMGIDPSADYLYPYVRSSVAKSPVSTAFFQVSKQGGAESDGMAGYAWEEDYYIRRDLPRLTDDDRKQIQRLSMEEILQLPPKSRIRRYVEDSRIRDIRQLRAMKTFARHFMGHIIHTTTRQDWGVLLLDSDEDGCPFVPVDGDEGGVFGRQFKLQAEALGHILRGA